MGKCRLFIFLLLFEISQLAFPVAALAASSCTQTNWLGSNWQYRKRINFNNAAQNENLTNFPVLVHLTSSNFEFGKAQSNGQDIRFTDSDGTTLLNYEVEKWDSGNGDADVWVNVPQVDASSNTDFIWMYYGNSNAGGAQNVNATWNSNFVIVQHLKETSGTATADSTSNGKNGAKVSATNPNPLISGQIDGAQTFDGATSKIDIAATNATNTFTMEAWIKRADTAAGRQFVFYVGNTDIELSANALNLNVTGFGQIAIATNTITDTTTWHHIAATRNGTTKKLYVDGVDVTGSTFDSSSDLSSASAIGYRAGVNSSFFNGSIDEVRLMNTSVSSNWIAAEYKNDTDTFNSFNQEEGYRSECSPATTTITSICSDTPPGSAPTITSIIPGTDSVILNWSKANSPVSYYALEFGTQSGNYQYGASNIGDGNATTYTVNSISPGVTYYFKLRAGNGCMPGAWSHEVAATTNGIAKITITTPIPTETPKSTETPSPSPMPTLTPTEIPIPFPSPVSFKFQLPKISFPRISINLTPMISAVNNLFATSAKRNVDALQGLALGLKDKWSDLFHYSKETISYAGLNIAKSFQKPAEFTKRVSDWIGYARISFGEIVLDNKPTEITEVKIENLTDNSVSITWKTNHLATSKVNYGETLAYGQDSQSDTKVHDHAIELIGLKPGTRYYFEVMSQNKNYVYDAHHEFVTPDK